MSEDPRTLDEVAAEDRVVGRGRDKSPGAETLALVGYVYEFERQPSEAEYHKLLAEMDEELAWTAMV